MAELDDRWIIIGAPLTPNYSFGRPGLLSPCYQVARVKRLEVRVKGRVQGVSFRYTTQQKAIELGVLGWVRNERNGDVTLAAEGEVSALEELLEFVKEGPSYARVDELTVTWTEAEGAFQRFRIAL